MHRRFPVIPVTFFGMVLGIGSLANGWRFAAKIWNMPGGIGDGVAILAFAIWLILIVLYAMKWLFYRPAALAELHHPVQSFFVVLVAVATMIAGLAILPLMPQIARAILIMGVAGQLLFGIWGAGTLWQGGRASEATTPVLYMPTVGGSFVSAMALAALGLPDWATLFFGAGFVSWVVLEAIIMGRLIHLQGLPPPIRSTIGIHLAPPAVGCGAYLGCTSGIPDILAQGLIGYGVFHLLVATRLWSWFRQQMFSPSYWAFSFGISALPLAMMRMVERGQSGAIAQMAPVFFGFANIFIATLFIGTLRLLVQGKMLPPAVKP